tara:strand:- start:80 stop:655 length:576 start_codon:yes stop_codon:yes gene_type:complete
MQPAVAAQLDAYLAAPPYTGRSRMEDREAIKGPVGGRWDATRKKWTARDSTVLLRMMRTGKWKPDVAATPEQIVAHLASIGVTYTPPPVWSLPLGRGSAHEPYDRPSTPVLTAEDYAHMERHRNAPPIPAYTATCSVCGLYIYEQFLDCACTSTKGIYWVRCPAPPCTRLRPAVSGVTQACACGDPVRYPA